MEMLSSLEICDLSLVEEHPKVIEMRQAINALQTAVDFVCRDHVDGTRLLINISCYFLYLGLPIKLERKLFMTSDHSVGIHVYKFFIVNFWLNVKQSDENVNKTLHDLETVDTNVYSKNVALRILCKAAAERSDNTENKI